ncbi:MAG: hypothetical protein JF924_18685 [Candidatus Dormibacteraeota bacterium]|nr:hypothetical protein [Candidatus Dormibacteraeota bacterium]
MGGPIPSLELVREAKLHEILGPSTGARLEASGVVARDGRLYVVFDSSSEIASVHAELMLGSGVNRVISEGPGRPVGYEDLAHDPSSNRFFALIEALPKHGAGLMARVDEYDHELRYIKSAWLDFPLDQANKGLEGLTCVRREEGIYLLALCEGNRCRGGLSGERPGSGRIQVFREGVHHWEHVTTIRLPPALEFLDYSSIALADDRIAVLSQASSALWIGELSRSTLEVVSEGRFYQFPRDGEGRTLYCNVEGVSWIAPDRLVVVSDRMKPAGQQKRCRSKDQSIHLFLLPPDAGGLDSAAAGAR